MDHQGITPQGIGAGITAEWVWNYFLDVDTMDPQQVAKYYHSDATFRFGNAAPVRGPEVIREMLAQFYTQIRSMHHQNTGLWLGDNSAVFEALVHFMKKDGSEVVLPAVSILRVQNGRLIDFRMTMDAAPLFQ